MKILTQSVAAQVQARRTRRLADLLAPVEELARQSAGLLSKPLAAFHVAGDEYQIPRYLFIGPRGGDDPIRLGLFAAIHGDEPEGANALVQLLQVLDQRPELARDFFLFVYPVCNPTGYEDGTRFSRAGFDLNREFWNNSNQPEDAPVSDPDPTHAAETFKNSDRDWHVVITHRELAQLYEAYLVNDRETALPAQGRVAEAAELGVRRTDVRPCGRRDHQREKRRPGEHWRRTADARRRARRSRQ